MDFQETNYIYEKSLESETRSQIVAKIVKNNKKIILNKGHVPIWNNFPRVLCVFYDIFVLMNPLFSLSRIYQWTPDTCTKTISFISNIHTAGGSADFWGITQQWIQELRISSKGRKFEISSDAIRALGIQGTINVQHWKLLNACKSCHKSWERRRSEMLSIF